MKHLFILLLNYCFSSPYKCLDKGRAAEAVPPPQGRDDQDQQRQALSAGGGCCRGVPEESQGKERASELHTEISPRYTELITNNQQLPSLWPLSTCVPVARQNNLLSVCSLNRSREKQHRNLISTDCVWNFVMQVTALINHRLLNCIISNTADRIGSE